MKLCIQTKYIKLFFAILCVSFSLQALALTKNGIDLEAVMKQMRFEYTQAMKAESTAVFNQHLKNFEEQLTKAQQFPFNEQRVAKATQGLNKVADVLGKLKLPATLDELNIAKQKLYIIDDLRNEYHDKKPSLWERFYEMIFGANQNNPPLILLK